MLRTYDGEKEQEVRDNLVKYYSSYSIAHGTYILAVAIGTFTFFQTLQIANDFFGNFSAVYSVATFSLLFSLLTYFMIKASYWGYLNQAAIHAIPMAYEKMVKEFNVARCDSFTLSFSLQMGALYVVSQDHKLVFFYARKIWRTLTISFIISVAVISLALWLRIQSSVSIS